MRQEFEPREKYIARVFTAKCPIRKPAPPARPTLISGMAKLALSDAEYDVARHGKCEAGAERGPIDGSDHRPRAVARGVEEFAYRTIVFRVVTGLMNEIDTFLDVRACREHVAHAGEDHDADVVAVAERVEQANEFLARGTTLRIHPAAGRM